MKHKIIESFKVNEWEIETEEGYKPILEAHRTISYLVYNITLENGFKLNCADNHIIITDTYDEIFAKDSLGKYIRTKSGISKVISVENLGYEENMYDLSIDSDKHTYYTNNILSHNTTTAVAFILWFTIFQNDQGVAITSRDLDGANTCMTRYKEMYTLLPYWMQPGIKVWNVKSIALSNASKVAIHAVKPAGVRSDSINLLYFDEFAYVPNNIADSFYNGTRMTISSASQTNNNVKLFITSTPNGYNLFYRLWEGANNKSNEFTPIFIKWDEIPYRDQAWYLAQKKGAKPEEFAKDVLCKFLGSTATLISPDVLELLEEEEPLYDDFEGLHVYEEPVKERKYFITVDPAYGVGLDYSSIVVFDITDIKDYKIVATYASNNISPDVLPNIINKLGLKYNDAYVLIENNIVSHVGYILYNDLQYPNIIFTETRARAGNTNDPRVTIHWNNNMQIGVKTTVRTKRLGCITLKALIENQQLKINDGRIKEELLSFINVNNSYQAEDDKHDDLVMCLVMFAWMTNDAFFKELTQGDPRTSIHGKEIANINNNLLIGFTSDELHGDEYYQSEDYFWEWINNNEPLQY